MRYLPAVVFVFTASHALAGPDLLRCNLTSGPVQQVRIQLAGQLNTQDLVLNEVTSKGVKLSRPLERKEWESRVLRLTSGNPQDIALLTWTNGEWVIAVSGPHVSIKAYADCF